MSQFQNYSEYVVGQANDFYSEYIDEAITEIKDGNTDMNEFLNDSRIHEWVDNDFIYVDLLDSAQILDQSDNIEDDSGLWEGQEPVEAIKTQAFFTYRNDLSCAVDEIFSERLQTRLTELENKLEELEELQVNEEDEEAEENLADEISELEEEIGYFEDAIESI